MGKPVSTTVATWAAAAIIVVSAASCGRVDYDDGAGFRDGFFTGYAQDCTLRSRPGPQRWQSAAYSRGYADGKEKGLLACRELRNEVTATTAALHLQAGYR